MTKSKTIPVLKKSTVKTAFVILVISSECVWYPIHVISQIVILFRIRLIIMIAIVMLFVAKALAKYLSM